ncbi:MAG TPA: sugar phosphate isomerase/epimerase family protein [Bryobacteraceae bacterium]|nr:sugar phosphate isomerase/epimerase family protein [Bryobacteraceae bacterium]HTQ86591.1 sugar phosphate isomerase/epimerase family protein [Candidatus Solibacter sp.]
MNASDPLTRRAFLATSAALPLALSAQSASAIPVGLELYSVRDNLDKDLPGTLQAVAKMGYQVVEFFAPYFKWTPEHAREVRKILDDTGMRCNSTHNGLESFSEAGLANAIELNHILGAHYIVLASPGKVTSLDGYRKVAESLTQAQQKLQAEGLSAGYHNHDAEFHLLEGTRPIEIIAANTPKELMLQFDVGTCVEVGSDPVAWIEANPGRIRSMHLKDWSPEHGYREMFGDGKAPWKKIFEAAETAGGAEYYLIEQEENPNPLEAVAQCLSNYRKLRAA